MTLILQLSPEREGALNAQARAQGVSAEQYALQVLERDLKSEDPPRRHISQTIREIMSDVPREVFESLPKDGASEHDHYLYGVPKRNPVNAVFADKFYWIALTTPLDPAHERAKQFTGPLVTTQEVLTEYLIFLCQSGAVASQGNRERGSHPIRHDRTRLSTKRAFFSRWTRPLPRAAGSGLQPDQLYFDAADAPGLVNRGAHQRPALRAGGLPCSLARDLNPAGSRRAHDRQSLKAEV